MLSFSTQGWNFEGSKEELLASFCCLNPHDRQFYPQFKEVNDCLAFRTLMLGFQGDTIPFEVSITFKEGNDKKITTIGDPIYPMTNGKDTRFETFNNVNLKKVTREFKNQSKIKFTMKIIKLDKGGATGQHSESGLCKICMEDEICFVFIPCGHEITCEKCAMDGRLENCPVCRKPIEKRIKTYKS